MSKTKIVAILGAIAAVATALATVLGGPSEAPRPAAAHVIADGGAP